MAPESKSFKIEIKALAEDGTFEGLASVYGVEDLGGDVVDRGAFTKTISEHSEVPILWEHTELIGRGSLQDSADGLIVKGRLTLAVRRAAEAYALLKDGALKGLSIGYQTVKKDFKGSIRVLREVKLHEVSLTGLPMNPHAQVMSVKSADLGRIEALEAQVQALSALVGERAATAQTEPAKDHSELSAKADSLLALFPR